MDYNAQNLAISILLAGFLFFRNVKNKSPYIFPKRHTGLKKNL